MGIAIVLGVVSWFASLAIGALLVFQSRRVGNVQDVKAVMASQQAEIEALKLQCKNLGEMFDSFKNREAVRASRKKSKEEQEQEAQTPPDSSEFRSPDDIVARFRQKQGLPF